MFALNPRLAWCLAALLFFTLSACEKDEVYPTTDFSETDPPATKSVAAASPADLPPGVHLVYDQFAPFWEPGLAEAFQARFGQPLWERAIVTSAPYLLVGYALDSTLVGPPQLPETVIVPFAKKGAVVGILISEFEPDGGEVRQKYISRTLHQVMQQYFAADYIFNRVASYAFFHFDNYDDLGTIASFSGDCPSECGCQILPMTGLCGIAEDRTYGPGSNPADSSQWYVSVVCPPSCFDDGSGGGYDDGGSTNPDPIDWGSLGFDISVNVGGVSIPAWYVPNYIDAINWTSRRPGSGGFQVNILSLEELLNRGDRDPNDDHSFGGGGELFDTPIFQNCLESAFPPADGEAGTTAGGDGLGGGEALWALLTDMFGQSAEVIHSINTIDSHIRSQTGAPGNQPTLTQDQWRYLILHSYEAADIAHALTTDQTTPATVSAYLTLKSTFDSCNSMPDLSFDLLMQDPDLFHALANHLAANPTDTEAMRGVNRVLAIEQCLDINEEMASSILDQPVLLNDIFSFLSLAGCEAGQPLGIAVVNYLHQSDYTASSILASQITMSARLNLLEVEPLEGIVFATAILHEIESFLLNHSGDDHSRNLSTAIAYSYAQIALEISPFALDMGEVGNPDDPLWEITKELLLDALKGLLADLIPGGTLATLGPELFDNVQNGNWMEGLYLAADIVLNEADTFFPAAKILSFGVSLAVTGKKLKRVFDAFKRAKSLGEEFLQRLYRTFRLRMNLGISTIRDNFQWVENTSKFSNQSAREVFDNLLEEFGGVEVMINPRQGTPIFKILELSTPGADNAIYMELYPNSESGFAWTIEFTIGDVNETNPSNLSTKFKIRFDWE